MIFIRDILIHFDIWNKIKKKKFLQIFFHFSKIHRGDPYDYDQNRKGPPYEFWKNEKKIAKIFFLNFITVIKMYQNIPYKNHF